MRDLLTLATITLLSTTTAAYAGEVVGDDLAAAKAKPAITGTTSSPRTSTRLAALDARMADHKLSKYKDTATKTALVEGALADPAPSKMPGDEAPMPALMASTQTLDSSKNMHDAIVKDDPWLASEGVDAAAWRDGDMTVSWDPATKTTGWTPVAGYDQAAYAPNSAKGALTKSDAGAYFDDAKLADAKPLGVDVASPFGVVSNSEIAAMQAKGDVLAMGGPVDPAEIVGEGWSTQDADGDGSLTPLEFGGWVASDAGKGELAIAAIEQRDSADEGTATVRLLNGTSLEFSAADIDNDARVSADELNAFIAYG